MWLRHICRRQSGRPDIGEERSFSWSKVEQLRLNTTDGFVWVSTSEGDEVTLTADIKAYVRDRSQSETARGYVSALVAPREENGVVTVVTEPEERPDHVELLVFYRVTVPKGTNIEITSTNGNVQISRGCGDVRVHGGNTDIQVLQPDGDVVAETVNGRIWVTSAKRGGHLHTVNGNVYADVHGGFLEADTTNGVIYARILGSQVEGCDLTTRNGGITVVVNEGASAKVLARTSRGLVKSTVPVETSQGGRGRRHLEGTIGAGAKAQLTMDTLNGNIVIAGSSS